MQGQIEYISTNSLSKGLFLCRRAKLKKLLNDVVAKYVSHQLVRLADYFVKDKLFFIIVGTFQFLLNESRAVLILRELDNVVIQITQSQIGQTGISEIFQQRRASDSFLN